MRMPLFLPLLAVALVEIALFVEIGGRIGVWPTIASVLATAAAGAATIRAQGLTMAGAVQSRLRAGRSPAPALAHGALILAAGLLLLTPGFLTDAVGLLLLVPPVRSALIRVAASRMVVADAASAWHFSRSDAHAGPHGSSRPGTVDGEYVVVEARDAARARGRRPGDPARPADGDSGR